MHCGSMGKIWHNYLQYDNEINSVLCHFLHFSANDLVPMIYEVLEGLVYMNQYGLTHRALSPQNILLDPEVCLLHNGTDY